MTAALAALEAEPLDLFCSKFIFERTPHIFEGDWSAYLDWKRELASHLSVDPTAMVLTGSSSIGFSLNPYKNRKEFDETSDIDVAIISPYYFDVAWHSLRNVGPEWMTWPNKAKAALKDHQKRHVYWGTIATDRLLAYLPFGKVWLSGLAEMSKVEPTVGREINARLYRDFDCLRAYQLIGLEKVRQGLLST